MAGAQSAKAAPVSHLEPDRRREAVSAPELPGHVALISESGVHCRPGEGLAGPHHAAHLLELPHRAEAARARPEGGAELARERPSVEI